MGNKNENVKLSSFEIKIEVIRYAKCSTSLASVSPLGRLRLTTHCPTLKKKESNCKTCKNTDTQ